MQSVLGVVTEAQRRRALEVVSLDSQFREEYRATDPKNIARVHDIVRGRVKRQDGYLKRCEIVEVIRADSPLQLATKVCLEVFGVPHEWPADCRPVNLDPKSPITTADYEHREDLRAVPFVTIDGNDAKDFDDAVYCEKAGKGWRLVVAIADVAHYVKADSTLDLEARRRGCSVYLPETVIPMLPEVLSNGICSLKPYEDRLSIVCDMQINGDGLVTSSTFFEAVIRSHGRLTYGEVAAFVDGGGLSGRAPPLRKSLSAFHQCYKHIASASHRRGTLDFDTGETKVDFQNGSPVGVDSIQTNDAHQMIELAMVSANVEAAKFLEQRNAIPMYRVHEPPVQMDPQLISVFQEREIYLNQRPAHALEIQTTLAQIRQSFERPQIWETALLGNMQKAHYAPQKLGHFGLALETYVHFTSPIRRYPDLLVHRQIKACLANRSPKLGSEFEWKQIGESLSACEIRAVSTERRVEGWMKTLLVDSIGRRNLQGTVVSVQPYGLFVELEDYGTSGLLHVSNIGSDYFEFSDNHLVGSQGGERYGMGDRLTVRCLQTQPALSRIDLELIQRR